MKIWPCTSKHRGSASCCLLLAPFLLVTRWLPLQQGGTLWYWRCTTEDRARGGETVRRTSFASVHTSAGREAGLERCAHHFFDRHKHQVSVRLIRLSWVRLLWCQGQLRRFGKQIAFVANCVSASPAARASPPPSAWMNPFAFVQRRERIARNAALIYQGFTPNQPNQTHLIRHTPYAIRPTDAHARVNTGCGRGMDAGSKYE
jgi:hypothetical protein